MLRVLHSVSNMDRAGIETMLMNYYRHMDRERIQFDFLANKKQPGDYDEEIRSMGGRIFLSPGLNPVKYEKYMRFMAELLRNEPEIRILHAHNGSMAQYALRGAQKAGLPTRIAHAHNTGIQHDYKWPLKMVCRAALPYAATDLWGCGEEAGIWSFGEKQWRARGVLLRNAIETERFAWQPEVRRRLRTGYGLTDRFVMGHVGRFSQQKNHSFLLDVFAAVAAKRKDARLVLIGAGELEDETRRKAHTLGLAEKVLFLGMREDINEWYQAMDVFVLPSLWEGLPVVGVEAQAAGLPCIFSRNVPPEVMLLDSSRSLSLECPAEEWAEVVLAAPRTERGEGARLVAQAGYDIAEEAEKLQQTYLQMAGLSEAAAERRR